MKPNPQVKTCAARFKIVDKSLFLKADNPRLCIPNQAEWRTHLLHDHHDTPIAGHLGVDKTYLGISRHFFWPRLSKDVKRYVASCDHCQRNKGTHQVPPGLLQPLPTPTCCWEQVSIDFIVQLPVTKAGYDTILVVVDRLP